MQSDIEERVEACSKEGSDKGVYFPFCYPTQNDVWLNGTTNNFIWNFNYPYYVSSPEIDLYLYYYVKFEYFLIKNFTNLPTSSGHLEVTIDDQWFMSPTTVDQNLTIYGYYLPSKANHTEEFANPDSLYPKQFNFTITQFASPSNNTIIPSITTSQNDPTDKSTSVNSTLSSNHLPGWAIAVIVIAIVAFICGVSALIWTLLLSRKNKNKLIPVLPQQPNTTQDMTERKYSRHDNHSSNSQSVMLGGFRSTDSVPISLGENNSSVKSYIPENMRSSFNREWNNEEEAESRRRRLGEQLLQRQLEEDGTSVKHAGRFTNVQNLADLPKSAIFEHPKH